MRSCRGEIDSPPRPVLRSTPPPPPAAPTGNRNPLFIFYVYSVKTMGGIGWRGGGWVWAGVAPDRIAPVGCQGGLLWCSKSAPGGAAAADEDEMAWARTWLLGVGGGGGGTPPSTGLPIDSNGIRCPSPRPPLTTKVNSMSRCHAAPLASNYLHGDSRIRCVPGWPWIGAPWPWPALVSNHHLPLSTMG